MGRAQPIGGLPSVAARFVVRPGNPQRFVADSALVHEPSSDRLHTLGGSGTHIFRVLTEAAPDTVSAAEVTEKFAEMGLAADVDDVAEFLDELTAAGLVDRVDRQ